MASRSLSIPHHALVTGALGLAFSLGGCADDSSFDPCAEAGSDDPACNSTADDGFQDDGTVDDGYLDDGYLDDGYYDTGWDDGYYDTGWDDGWDDGLDDGYYTDPFPTTDPVTTEPSASWTTAETDPGTTDITASSSTTGTDSSGTDSGTTGTSTDSGTDSSGSGTDSGTDSDTGGDEVNFPPLGVFGDDVIEPDLVGTWSLQWTPDGTTWDSVLTIDDSGNFLWRETSADCTADTLATGVLWVEPGQLVMHVETWDRALPWDTLAIAGQEFAPPFRLRMSYALLGPNLGLTAPDGIVEAEPFTGRAYLQTDFQGNFIAGTYIGEAELLAAFQGETEPKVIVRDRWTATLDAEPADIAESTGIVFRDQIYWGLDPPVATPQLFESGNWTCLYGCTLPAGATLINGGNLYAYGPYAGYQRMMTFASGRSFKRDIDTDCP